MVVSMQPASRLTFGGTRAKSKERIGYFRVYLRLHFKARLSAKSLLFVGSNYHTKNFALRLALKERFRRTRKWSIQKRAIRRGGVW